MDSGLVKAPLKIVHVGQNFEDFHEKNDFSQIDQGSSQEASPSPRASKNMKNHHRSDSGRLWDHFKKSSKIILKPIILKSFWTLKSHFRHAGACVIPAGGLSGRKQWLVEHILVLYRVIRGQTGASLKFSRKWHLEEIFPSKCWVWEIWPFVELRCIFSRLCMLF